jgi:hypothetical protein
VRADSYRKSYHIDISPELIGYRPIRLDTLLKLFPSKRTLRPVLQIRYLEKQLGLKPNHA